MKAMKPRQPGSPYETLEALYAEVGIKMRGEADLGVQTVAAFLGCSVGTIYKQLDPDQRDEHPYTRVSMITEHFGVTAAASDLARRAGGVFFKLDDVAACADLDGFCALVREAGEAIATTAAAQADGVFTRDERAEVRAHLKDLLRAVVAYDQFLAGKDDT